MKFQIGKNYEKIVENKGIHQVSKPNRICPHPAEPNHTQPHPPKKAAMVEKDVENNVEITTSKKEFNFSLDIFLKYIMAPIVFLFLILCCFIFVFSVVLFFTVYEGYVTDIQTLQKFSDSLSALRYPGKYG